MTASEDLEDLAMAWKLLLTAVGGVIGMLDDPKLKGRMSSDLFLVMLDASLEVVPRHQSERVVMVTQALRKQLGSARDGYVDRSALYRAVDEALGEGDS